MPWAVAFFLVVLVATQEGLAGTPARRDLVLATTTSTQDSGLLDVLVPVFEEASGYHVKTVAVGSGQALALAGRGEADVVLSHAPELEEKAALERAIVNRRLVMHNDFLLVGPPDDPAKVAGLKDAAEAWRRIAAARARFVSRGDDSGTHLLERKLWTAAGIEPAGASYVEAGQGMGATLTIASEKAAYTLTDRATYLAFKARIRLVPFVQGDVRLLNPYHVLEVNPTKFPRVNHGGARAFADFLVSPAAQDRIGSFGVAQYGERLFVPDAGKRMEDLGR